jgi:hypothetical protein
MGNKNENTVNKNIAIGALSFVSGTSSSEGVVCVGYNSGNALTTGTGTTLIGHEAGTNITSVANNTALGYKAIGGANAAGADNTCIGFETGIALNGGANNTLIGSNAGHDITTGSSNTFIGYLAGDATDDGDFCVGVGYESLSANCSDRNTSIGYQSGLLVTGISNTCVGYKAGDAITSGNYNTAIGQSTDCDATSNNQIAIGNGAVTDGANKIRLGNGSIATCNIQTDWTVDSDVRIKKEIVDNTLGLSFINNLKPRKYKKLHPADWDETIREDRYKNGFRDEFDDKKMWDGLIAQEVKEAIDKSGVTFSGWEIDSKGKQGVQYSSLVVPLIKAVQELSQQIEDLKKG